MILALELVEPARDISAADVGRLVPPVRTVAVAIAHPRAVHARHAVAALEFGRDTRRRDLR